MSKLKDQILRINKSDYMLQNYYLASKMIPFSRSFKENPDNLRTLKGFDITNSVGKL